MQFTAPRPSAGISAQSGSVPTTDLGVALVAGIASCVSIYVLASGLILWPVFLLLHAAIITCLVIWIDRVRQSSRDSGPALLAAVAVAAAGPIGAVAALLLIEVRRHREPPHLLDAWYQRIANAVDTDDVTRLCEQVATGRTSDLTGTIPASFPAVMQSGTMHDRQAMLGIIARNFHPDYLPALMLALKNPEPMIRVQAAAVATRVRGDLRAFIDCQAAVSPPLAAGSAPALAAARHLDVAIDSGLLDEGDRIRARVLAGRLTAASPAASAVPTESLRAVPVLERGAVEAALLRDGRFGQLRIGRRMATVAAAGRYRVRRRQRAAGRTMTGAA